MLRGENRASKVIAQRKSALKPNHIPYIPYSDYPTGTAPAEAYCSGGHASQAALRRIYRTVWHRIWKYSRLVPVKLLRGILFRWLCSCALPPFPPLSGLSLVIITLSRSHLRGGRFYDTQETVPVLRSGSNSRD